jgi:hypothetical protein
VREQLRAWVCSDDHELEGLDYSQHADTGYEPGSASGVGRFGG